jgi:hypothetical protein
MNTKNDESVVPQVGRAEVDELGDLFLAVSLMLKEQASRVLEEEVGLKNIHFGPLDATALGSVNTLTNPRGEPTCMLLYILRLWMEQGDGQEGETPLFRIVSPNLRTLLEDPGLSDRSPVVGEVLAYLSTRYLRQEKHTGAGPVPFWKIKPTLEFRATQYMRGDREQWVLALARRLYQRHHRFVERHAKRQGYGLVELRS